MNHYYRKIQNSLKASIFLILKVLKKKLKIIDNFEKSKLRKSIHFEAFKVEEFVLF
jgi:hypothetical protein